MAITLADFTKIWASTSPLTPYSFSESNYKEGWNFVGGTPPARQMWDSIQKQNDEKLKYIVDNFLPLAGGTMAGAIFGNPLTLTADDGNDSADLVLNPSGSATWNGKEVERVNASGTNYIRFESGLQICWEDLGGVNYNTQKDWNLPVPFKDTNYLVCAFCRQLGFGSAMTISAQAGTTSVAWVQQWNSSSTGTLLVAVAIGWWK